MIFPDDSLRTRRAALRLMAAGAPVALAPSLLAAQDKNQPAPLTIGVLGDSLADGLWGSIYRAYVRLKHVKVLRLATNSAGFTAYEFEKDLDKALAKDKKIDVLIFQVGANDRQRAFDRETKKAVAFKSENWERVYRANAARFAAHVQEKKIPMFWAGLPIMRKDDATADAKLMNGIYRDVAAAHDATFIDVWPVTAGKDGKYDGFIEDTEGVKKRFRADDGIHFTELGYDHVAGFVMNVVREKLPELMAGLNQAEHK